MARAIAVPLLTIAVGLAVGAGSALAWMKQGGSVVQGDWVGSRLTGSADADPWTRAQVALTGLLAFNRSEAIYFRRMRDESGQRLRESCRYRVSGGPLPGRWWSVTVYDGQGYLPLNADNALSIDATRARPDREGRWQAIVADRPVTGMPWVSSRHAGNFDLTLRIYLPDAAAQADFATIPMPRVERLDCTGEHPA